MMWGPTKYLGRIGSAVLTFIGYKQTSKVLMYLIKRSKRSKIDKKNLNCQDEFGWLGTIFDVIIKINIKLYFRYVANRADNVLGVVLSKAGDTFR